MTTSHHLTHELGLHTPRAKTKQQRSRKHGRVSSLLPQLRDIQLQRKVEAAAAETEAGAVDKKSLPASFVDNTSPRKASTADTSDDACNGTATSMNLREKFTIGSKTKIVTYRLQIDDEELPSKRSRSKKEVIRSCSSKSNRHGKRIYLCSSEGCANQAIQVQGRVCIRHMLNTHSSFSAYL
jgi:hypothetical protein